MNESRKKCKCNCVDDEPEKCYSFRLMKPGEKPILETVHHLCSCPCHADYLEGDTDVFKG